MVLVRSLGLAEPTALPFLIAEGILPHDPSPSSYSWTRVCTDPISETTIDEELIQTETCVAWSRGPIVYRIFRFEIENEPVKCAFFTRFPASGKKLKAKASSTISKESVSGGRSHPATLRIQKTRSGRTAGGEGKTLPREDDHQSTLIHHSTAPHSIVEDQALVVILKTQAHIFFLTSSSHVVPLPFEVSSAYPTPYGMILQRELPSTLQESPKMPAPPAPFNTFEFQFRKSTPGAYGAQSAVTNDGIGPPPGPHRFSAFLASNMAPQSPSANRSAHVHMQDPLQELGNVFGIEDPVVSSRTSLGRTRDSIEPLEPDERILYTSTASEVDESSSEKLSLFLMVSLNCRTGQYNLWTMSLGTAPSVGIKSKRSTLKYHREKTKRKSSHGSTTPGQRTSLGLRDSFGGYMDPLRDQNTTEDDFVFSTQLEPVIDPQASHFRQSRRISSHLSRVDASINKDTLNTNAQGQTGRRGPSLGARGLRTSLAPNSQRVVSNQSQSSINMGLSGNFSDTDNVVFLEDLDLGSDSQEGEAAKSKRPLQPMQRSLLFTKVYSFAANKSFSPLPISSEPLSSRTTVFTLRPPKAKADGAMETIVYIMDRDAQRLSVLHLKANTKASQPKEKQISAAEVTLLNIQHETGLIDACKVCDVAFSRIVTLRQTGDNVGQLSLESPWHQPFPFRLPSELLVRNPWHVGPLMKQRSTSLKRISSGGLEALEALRSCSSLEEIDVLDSRKRWHRFEIQLSPRNPLVSSLLLACELVLPRSDWEQEPLTRAWWEARLWLSSLKQKQADEEWVAFIIVIFSMFVPFLEKRRASIYGRTKRKSLSLRSSTGAAIDLRAFESILSQESLEGAGSRTWMQESCWEWAIKHPGTMNYGKRSLQSLGEPAPHRIPERKVEFITDCLDLTLEFIESPAGQIALGDQGYLPTARGMPSDARFAALPLTLVVLHFLHEEKKLSVLDRHSSKLLVPLLAQLGGWLGWDDWSWKESSYYMLSDSEMDCWVFDDRSFKTKAVSSQEMPPPSIFNYVESACYNPGTPSFPTLLDIVRRREPTLRLVEAVLSLTPRTILLIDLLKITQQKSPSTVMQMSSLGLDVPLLDSLPEGIAAPLRSVIAANQASPQASLPKEVLDMVGRYDLSMLETQEVGGRLHGKAVDTVAHDSLRDVHTICISAFDAEPVGSFDGSIEIDRQAITRMIFKDDQRFSEAMRLLDPLKHPVATCGSHPDLTDTELLEYQQELVKLVAVRTLSVSPGRGMLFYNARAPLLTERPPIHGFTLGCVMKPMNTTITADRNTFTEEKVSWAFFHAGVETGLSISKGAKGISTSWILYNKPPELSNRHAGFLLALGLNGHLKSIAKWVAFKYLTPKHTMTSIGLLLGLAASYFGTSDSLVTRLLSVHVTRMLPPGAAELNLSPLTQTTGIMGIGLLYCGTQHRRMSEIMLSEMENVEQDDNINPMENYRDEGYRLAAGFALGYINLGQGNNLKGLQDMRIVERLLALAVATKKVDIVHILDKATAAATVATALIFLKTEDLAVARKIDIPDTTHQFEYVRPDIFLLRTVARHLIMWKRITPNSAWIKRSLPAPLRPQSKLTKVKSLHTEDLPIFNIVAGLCLSIGLRFAGTARKDVCELLCSYLDQFIRICRLPALTYDAKLSRITTRNCQDITALAAAMVMAGTGNIKLFRRLRSLHGRTDAFTPYGSHLAAHQAIGVLFLGGGTHTFGTSNVAVASLLCAFYPLFPTDVLDNKCHLQAFRHFWALAAEPRCLVARSAETHKPLPVPVSITLGSGEKMTASAPCLLPELNGISKIQSEDPKYWRVTLDFAKNFMHLGAFRRHQSMFLRRRSPYDGASSVFSATLKALNDAQASYQFNMQIFSWIFDLPSFSGLDRAERALVLPIEDTAVSQAGASRLTAVDDKLTLERECMESGRADRLFNLRLLFAWADGTRRNGGRLDWLGVEVVEALRAKVALKGGANAGEW